MLCEPSVPYVEVPNVTRLKIRLIGLAGTLSLLAALAGNSKSW